MSVSAPLPASEIARLKVDVIALFVADAATLRPPALTVASSATYACVVPFSRVVASSSEAPTPTDPLHEVLSTLAVEKEVAWTLTGVVPAVSVPAPRYASVVRDTVASALRSLTLNARPIEPADAPGFAVLLSVASMSRDDAVTEVVPLT